MMKPIPSNIQLEGGPLGAMVAPLLIQHDGTDWKPLLKLRRPGTEKRSWGSP